MEGLINVDRQSLEEYQFDLNLWIGGLQNLCGRSIQVLCVVTIIRMNGEMFILGLIVNQMDLIRHFLVLESFSFIRDLSTDASQMYRECRSAEKSIRPKTKPGSWLINGFCSFSYPTHFIRVNITEKRPSYEILCFLTLQFQQLSTIKS